MGENYTLGYSDGAMAFLRRRRLESHGAFLIPHLRPGLEVLDCGCGPGGITLDIAGHVAPGRVTGVDRDASQVGVATERARAAGIGNVSFRQASVYELPFADGQFDALFSHALFEHLADPVRAARECLRVVKPGGIVGVATPDWGGFLVAPVSPAMTAAIRAYEDLQHRNGGNPRVGRELGRVFAEAGFAEVRLSARYENYAPLSVIGELLAFQLEDDGQPHHAETLRAWQHDPAGLFAQAWVSCLARRP